MAGKRQHFIPQFLQRGFLKRSNRSQEFTCVYRIGGECFSTNIKNVGVEGYFYSTSESDADDAITESENEFSETVVQLRLGSESILREPERLGSLLAHLEARSRHFRQNFLRTGTRVTDLILKRASDPKFLEPYLLRVLRNDPSLLQEAMTTELRKYGIPREHLPEVMKRAAPFVENAMLGAAAQMNALAPHLQAQLLSRLADAAKAGHVRALAQTVAPVQKATAFSQLQFQVHRLPSPTLVLGDSMVVFHIGDQREFKPFFDKRDQLRAALLPISADAILVGAPGAYTPDTDLLRLEVARCSLEFFLANEESESNAELSFRIGENAHLLSDAEIEQIVGSAFDE